MRIALDTGECRAPASGMQDLDKGYRAVRRYTKSRERPVRLVAHCRHPSMRCLQPRGQQAVGFGFRREPESILKMANGMKIIEAILKGERVYQADPDDSEYWPFFVMVNVVEMVPPVSVAWWKPSL